MYSKEKRYSKEKIKKIVISQKLKVLLWLFF